MHLEMSSRLASIQAGPRITQELGLRAYQQRSTREKGRKRKRKRELRMSGGPAVPWSSASLAELRKSESHTLK